MLLKVVNNNIYIGCLAQFFCEAGHYYESIVKIGWKLRKLWLFMTSLYKNVCNIAHQTVLRMLIFAIYLRHALVSLLLLGKILLDFIALYHYWSILK